MEQGAGDNPFAKVPFEDFVKQTEGLGLPKMSAEPASSFRQMVETP